MVHKDSADARAGQQVVHVVVGARQIGHLVLQFGVDRGQLLVDRLQFFLGGLQFLVGRLQLLVHGLHLLVGGLELLVGGCQFLVGGLEIFLLGPQFLLQRRNARIDVRVFSPGFSACIQDGGRFGRVAGRAPARPRKRPGTVWPRGLNPGPRAPAGPSD